VLYFSTTASVVPGHVGILVSVMVDVSNHKVPLDFSTYSKYPCEDQEMLHHLFV
jgi:hypothetical protein